MIWLLDEEEPIYRIPLPDYGDFRPEALKIPLLAALEREKLPTAPECTRLRGGPFRQARPCLVLYHAEHRRRWPTCIITPVRQDHTLCLQLFIHKRKHAREEHQAYIRRLVRTVETVIASLAP